MLFNVFKREQRSGYGLTLSDPQGWEALGFSVQSQSGEDVNEVTALGVPAIWAAVNVIAGTIAALPLHVYKQDGDAKIRATSDPLERVLNVAANGFQTPQQVLKWAVSRLVLEGRAVIFINRDGANRVKRLEPLNISQLVIQQRVDPTTGEVSRFYVYRKLNGQELTYRADEVLDFVLQLQPDNLSHYSPIILHRNSIGLVIAAERYASNLFASGGVPPLVLNGPAMSPQAAERASDQIAQALANARDRNRNVTVTPTGYELKDLGFDPQKQQMIELRRFQISEVSRIFNIAPAMLHDLSTGTYSNVEQQNLNFAQHTLVPLVELMEQELNLKLFPQRAGTNFVEFSLDGIQRGDFASRMSGYAQAVQNAVRTPNEIRALENLPAVEGGDKLYIQGATVPLDEAGQAVDQTENSSGANKDDKVAAPKDNEKDATDQ